MMRNMRKLVLLVVGLLTIGAASAQDGWQHTLLPVFPEPLDHWLLPWDAPAEVLEITDCAADTQDIPFLGQEYRYWCFFVPGRTLETVLVDLGTAAVDMGMFETLRMMGDPSGAFGAVSSSGERLDVWHREETNAGAIIGIAWRGKRAD